MKAELIRSIWRSPRGVAITLVAMLAGACAANVTPPGDQTAAIGAPQKASVDRHAQGVRIALLLPLAGVDQTAAVAKAMKQAAEMALFELDNPAVQLVVKDDRGSAEGARAAAEEAIRDGAEVVLGPLLSRAVPGAAGAARTSNVPVIAFSSDQTVAGQGVYLMSFLAEAEVSRVVAYAASQGKRRFAALVPDDAYGRAVEPAFRSAVQRSGGTVGAVEFYPVHANGMVEPARRVMASIKSDEQAGEPVDALFVPGGPEQLPQLGPLIGYSGIDTARIKLLGTGAWDFPNLGRDATFVGGWFPGPDPRGFADFAQRFARTFGSAPPRIASLAHDAVAMAVDLSVHPRGQRFTPANLTRSAGFQGVDGVVRFLPSGMSERALAVLEVQPFGATVLDPAPRITSTSQVSQVPARTN